MLQNPLPWSMVKSLRDTNTTRTILEETETTQSDNNRRYIVSDGKGDY